MVEEEQNDASRAALREWLPSAAELLHITEYEVTWRAQPTGACHPALLLAQLHGERLGAWALTEEVAQGVLQIEEFAAPTRVEAHRLLGRARAALGRREAACEAAEAAVAEAAAARYVWLEMLSLRDLLAWSDAEAAARNARSRLARAARRVKAPPASVRARLSAGS